MFYNDVVEMRDMPQDPEQFAVSAASPHQTAPRMSVVIPCYNARAELVECLAAIARADDQDSEYIVVDDGSDDDPSDVIRSSSLPLQFIRIDAHAGAAAARNLGARRASGDILVFLDADVCVHHDTLRRILNAFEETPRLGALMGSYDVDPSEPGFHSQFRNLLHSYVHQTGRREASTFWTGCGAVYRHVFLQHQGFDETPGMIDDVEFGFRLHRSGIRIDLRPEIQVQHRKRWTLRSWIETDFRLRGIPWTLLILRERSMPNVLNLDYRNRASIAVTWAALTLGAASLIWPEMGFVALALIGVTLWLNRRLYSFLKRRHGLRFAVASAAAHLLHLLVSGASFLAGTMMFALSARREERVLEDLAGQ
jgi:GT2 family glycosyltransferase